MTVKRILAAIILVPLAILLIAFIIENRAPVALTLNLFGLGGSDFNYEAPLFIWLFLFLILGLLIGGATIWLSQHKYRKALKHCQAELQSIKMQATKRENLSSPSATI
ncbi:lipopolysaccharide assembly protein LapA domain-containing protein [Bartonella sp. DGB2]|uniref:lipopolysaccharide assembly protein LapA domain-containing protein n=1 Tax=Bartonella sp. DGB2 TaxID=3388426 RepID=UPI00398F9A0C